MMKMLDNKYSFLIAFDDFFEFSLFEGALRIKLVGIELIAAELLIPVFIFCQYFFVDRRSDEFDCFFKMF
jgi:hypothetical protein